MQPRFFEVHRAALISLGKIFAVTFASLAIFQLDCDLVAQMSMDPPRSRSNFPSNSGGGFQSGPSFRSPSSSYRPPSSSYRSPSSSYNSSSDDEHSTRIRGRGIGRLIMWIVIGALGLGGAGAGAGVYKATSSRSLEERKQKAVNNGQTWGGPGTGGAGNKPAGTGRPTYNPNAPRPQTPTATPYPSSYDQYAAQPTQQQYPPQQYPPQAYPPQQQPNPLHQQTPQNPSGGGPKLPPVIRPPQ